MVHYCSLTQLLFVHYEILQDALESLFFGHGIPWFFAFRGLKLYYRKKLVILRRSGFGYLLYAASQTRAVT